jgi:NAD(P)-dependent dehydrogenase (short-subunit alcohol dehydrogenase family)
MIGSPPATEDAMTGLEPLTGKVALVTGVAHGAGRGVAVALGEAGATVYCTGRTTREHRSEYDRPETIEETAELVDEAGGPASRSRSTISSRPRSRRSSSASTPSTGASTFSSTTSGAASG